MPTYDVIILPSAERDLSRNVDYIFYDKHSPETASQLLAGFRKKIQSLDYMPERYELDEDDDLSAKGIRKCYFKNYKIFFMWKKSPSGIHIASLAYAGGCDSTFIGFGLLTVFFYHLDHMSIAI